MRLLAQVTIFIFEIGGPVRRAQVVKNGTSKKVCGEEFEPVANIAAQLVLVSR